MGNAWTDERARTTLREIFDAAIGSAAPDAAIRRHLPEKPKGRCIVVGVGKASAAMAAALDAAWADVALSGVVATRYGHAVPAGRIRIIEAGHPVPDVESERAARTMLHAVSDLRSDDLVIALISGGGSALLALPAGDMSLADKQTINKALLLSGAAIGEMNAVRKHLSAIKGGRRGAAASDGAGKGGRNTEFLLSFAVANQAQPGIWALADDSDGIDGTEDAAGAIVTPDTLARGRAAGLDARRYLTAHDSYSYFDALGVSCVPDRR